MARKPAFLLGALTLCTLLPVSGAAADEPKLGIAVEALGKVAAADKRGDENTVVTKTQSARPPAAEPSSLPAAPAEASPRRIGVLASVAVLITVLVFLGIRRSS